LQSLAHARIRWTFFVHCLPRAARLVLVKRFHLRAAAKKPKGAWLTAEMALLQLFRHIG
jgi:hypothetical protein